MRELRREYSKNKNNTKEKKWQLYQKLGTFAEVAKKMHRDPSTVSRYVHEFEAAVGAASYILNKM